MINLLPMIKAPIQQGDVVGTYVVQDQHNETILQQPIVALKTIPKGNILQRGRDFITLNIKSAISRFRT